MKLVPKTKWLNPENFVDPAIFYFDIQIPIESGGSSWIRFVTKTERLIGKSMEYSMYQAINQNFKVKIPGDITWVYRCCDNFYGPQTHRRSYRIWLMTEEQVTICALALADYD